MSPNNDLSVGISTGCFYKIPILECLEPIKQSGFTLLEISSCRDHLNYHDTSLVNTVSDRLKSLHLQAYSFHAPFADHIDISSPNPNSREIAYTELCLAMDAAAKLGTRYFVLHPGPEKSDLPERERLQRLESAAGVLNEIASRCRRLGMWLVLENMLPHLFSGHERSLLWLFASIGSREVGLCLDTGHAFLSRRLESIIHKMSGHTWMVHASDNRGVYDEHLPPGEGLIDWSSVLRQLLGSGFRGTLILEMTDLPDVLSRASRSRMFLRNLSARVEPSCAQRG